MADKKYTRYTKHNEKRATLAITLIGGPMRGWITPLKMFSYAVILLMLAAITYAAIISVRYWPAISV